MPAAGDNSIPADQPTAADSPADARPTVGVSMGDPGSIAPEVLVKALADPGRRRSARWVVYGSSAALLDASHDAEVEPFWWTVARSSGLADHAAAHDVVLIDRDDETGPEAGIWRREDTADGGAASYAYVEDALADAAAVVRTRGEAAGQPAGPSFGAGLPLEAVVTGPISKLAWAMAGRKKWAGHTELVAARLGGTHPRMSFVLPELRVMLVTAHQPLMTVADTITLGRVIDTIQLAHDTCLELGLTSPRVAVCGLNPHAGENGLLGTDEERVVTPAVKHARGQGLDVHGPLPGDTVFSKALGGPGRRPIYDVVVAMYHDQGLIPVKLLGFDRAVNYTAGLPAPRTSPDHGTAFDIAGRNVADPGSMAAAMDLAVKLALGRRVTQSA